ncbi:MAG: ATPase domain-containing protein [Gammaproteobacteria bacterium]
MQFLDACSDREPGLFFGFYESPARLLANSRSLGLSLPAHVAAGSLEFSWHPVAENILDELGHGLVELVQARGVRRLVVDGLAGFFAAATQAERMERFLACLCNELRRLGATTLFTVETRDVTGITASTQFTAVSGIFDNVLYTRAASAQPASGPTLSIVKMRGGAFDRSIRALRVGAPGVALEDEPAPPTSAGETIDLDAGIAGAPK